MKIASTDPGKKRGEFLNSELYIAAARLAELRQKDPPPLPEADLIETKPIAIDCRDVSIVDVWLRDIGRFPKRGNLCDRLVVVDLDDTLLHGSLTQPGVVFSEQHAPPAPGYRYGVLRRSWPRTLKHGWRGWRQGTPYHTVDRDRYPSFEAPWVVVKPNIPLLICLRWLRREKVRLALASATSALRLSYLRARLPILDEIFDVGFVAAEQLHERACLAAASNIDRLSEPGWHMSQELHEKRPRSIMVKSPWAIATALSTSPFDVLVDDSVIIADLFATSGLSDRIVRTTPDRADVPHAIATLLSVLDRLEGKPSAPHLASVVESLPAVSTTSPPRSPMIEDPFYFPLLHVRDQTESAPDAMN